MDILIFSQLAADIRKMARYRPWLNSYQCTEHNLNVKLSDIQQTLIWA